MYCLYSGKRKISVENNNILPFEKCAEHYQQFMKLDKFVSFGRPESGTVIKQLMTELDVSNN